MIPIPQGYSKPPLDYEGQIYLESQMRDILNALVLDVIRVAEAEADEYSTDYYFWTVQNIINTIKKHYGIPENDERQRHN